VALEFPEDAFVDAKGAPYAGELFIEYALLPTAESILTAPGERTARVDQQESTLESFGREEGVDNRTNLGEISLEDGTPLC
jgi:hypothetical protein